MQIAIPTKAGVVDDHFGHCEYYTIFTIANDKQISDTRRFDAPSGCGCKSGVAVTLQEMGVNVMLAGNMGDGAKNVLEKNNIKVVRGCSGDINEVISNYLKGDISDSGEGCDSHGADHVCEH